LPSIETAIAVSASGSCRTAASALSGRRTVREPTIASYWSKTHRLEAMLGAASRASSSSSGLAPTSSIARLP